MQNRMAFFFCLQGFVPPYLAIPGPAGLRLWQNDCTLRETRGGVLRLEMPSMEFRNPTRREWLRLLGMQVALGLLGWGVYFLGPGCPFWRFWSVECPGCGFTRACLLALRGEFAEAWGMHPLFPLAVPLWFLLFGGIFFPAGSAFHRVQPVGLLAILAAFLLRWAFLRCL